MFKILSNGKFVYLWFRFCGKYIYSKLNKSKINISISDKKFDTEISVKNNLLINANKISVKIKKIENSR